MSPRSSRYHNYKRKRRSRFSFAAVIDDFKFAQRRAAGRERFANAQKLAVVLTLLTVALLIFTWNWSGLFVSQVNVTGLHYTNLSAVVQKADVGGYHVFGLAPAKIQTRVEQLPFVRRARVTILPASVLRIRVEERQPRFVWQGAEQSLWVDAEGVLLPASAAAHLSLPVLVDDKGALVAPVAKEEQKRLRPEYAKRVALLFAQDPALRVLNYRVPEGFSFRWKGRTTVYFGEADDLSRQWRLFQGAVNDFARRHNGALPSVIDASRPDSAIIKP